MLGALYKHAVSIVLPAVVLVLKGRDVVRMGRELGEPGMGRESVPPLEFYRNSGAVWPGL